MKTLENPVYSTNKLQSEKEYERKLADAKEIERRHDVDFNWTMIWYYNQ